MLLPHSPSLDEIEAHIPRINPVPPGRLRPFWSVMIPTYNSGNYLRRTLESVLRQDPGPEQMQIEVVDGASTRDNPKEVLNDLGRGRVGFYRLPVNKGAAFTFNAALSRSYGHWVHLLHGDDMVAPGFYDTFADAINEHPAVVMALSGNIDVDEHDRFLRERPCTDVGRVGIIRGFAEEQAFRQKAPAAAAVVVRRSAYEAAGGFCEWFSYVLDMDMWLRISLQGDVLGIRAPYALLRQHSHALTTGGIVSGDNIRERVLLTLINYARMRSPGWVSKARVWKQEVADFACCCAWAADGLGSTGGRLTHASWAFRLTPRPRTFSFLVKSWFKHLLLGGA